MQTVMKNFSIYKMIEMLLLITGLAMIASADEAATAKLMETGKMSFMTCAACHGMDGKGNQAMGAPNLTDATWLHGWGDQAIVKIVTEGRGKLQPLDPNTKPDGSDNPEGRSRNRRTEIYLDF